MKSSTDKTANKSPSIKVQTYFDSFTVTAEKKRNKKRFDYLLIEESRFSHRSLLWTVYVNLDNSKKFAYINPRHITINNVELLSDLADNIYVDKSSYSKIRAQYCREKTRELENTTIEQINNELLVNIDPLSGERILLKKALRYSLFEKVFLLAEDFKNEFNAKTILKIKNLIDTKDEFIMLTEEERFLDNYLGNNKKEPESYKRFSSFKIEHKNFKLPYRNQDIMNYFSPLIRESYPSSMKYAYIAFLKELDKICEDLLNELDTYSKKEL